MRLTVIGGGLVVVQIVGLRVSVLRFALASVAVIGVHSLAVTSVVHSTVFFCIVIIYVFH